MRDVINESSLTYLIFSDPQDLSQVNDDGAPFDAGNNVDFPDDGHEVSLGPGGVHISGTGGGLRGGVGRHGQHRGRQHYCK